MTPHTHDVIGIFLDHEHREPVAGRVEPKGQKTSTLDPHPHILRELEKAPWAEYTRVDQTSVPLPSRIISPSVNSALLGGLVLFAVPAI